MYSSEKKFEIKRDPPAGDLALFSNCAFDDVNSCKENIIAENQAKKEMKGPEDAVKNLICIELEKRLKKDNQEFTQELAKAEDDLKEAKKKFKKAAPCRRECALKQEQIHIDRNLYQLQLGWLDGTVYSKNIPAGKVKILEYTQVPTHLNDHANVLTALKIDVPV